MKKRRKQIIRLQDRDRELIFKMHAVGVPVRIIAKAFDVTHPTILNVIKKDKKIWITKEFGKQT